MSGSECPQAIGEEFESVGEVVAAGGEGDSQGSLGGWSVSASVHDHHAVVDQQAATNLVRWPLEVSGIGHGEESSFGTQDSDVGDVGQRGNDELPATTILGHHLEDTLLWTVEGRDCGILYKRCRSTTGLLQYEVHCRNYFGRCCSKTDSPAGHREILRETVNHYSFIPVGGCRRGNISISNSVVNLI